MPCFMPIDGSLQEVDDSIYDAMVQALHQETAPPAKKGRINPDGSYNKRPLDENYSKKYYQDNLTTPFTCPDCKRVISSKSNLSKHRQTKICKRYSSNSC